MAVVVQANLAQLKVADAKRRGIATDDHEIKIASPGAVRRFRDSLIDRHLISAYSALELQLRLREVWGHYCAIAWLFEQDPVDASCHLVTLPDDTEMRCAAAVKTKHAEVHAVLWRLRFEQRKRKDSDYVAGPTFLTDQRFAEKIPASVHGKQPEDCTDGELLLGACEHVGMLATLAWVADSRSKWRAPELMAVGDQPF